jgi:hypothetical protein
LKDKNGKEVSILITITNLISWKMASETPSKPTRTYAEQFGTIEITAEQRREARANALEMMRKCEFCHPEWDPDCKSLQDLKGMLLTNLAPIVWSTKLTEILHEHPSGTPEWEPVCEFVPLPVSESALLAKWQHFSKPVSTEPFKWTECQRVVMPPAAPAVPQSAEDVVEVYRALRQPTSLPDMPPPITKLTYGNLW